MQSGTAGEATGGAPVSDWTRRVDAAVHARDVENLLRGMTLDAWVRLSNAPPAVGRDAI